MGKLIPPVPPFLVVLVETSDAGLSGFLRVCFLLSNCLSVLESALSVASVELSVAATASVYSNWKTRKRTLDEIAEC